MRVRATQSLRRLSRNGAWSERLEGNDAREPFMGSSAPLSIVDFCKGFLFRDTSAMRSLLLLSLLLLNASLAFCSSVSGSGISASLLCLLPGFLIGRRLSSSVASPIDAGILATGCAFGFWLLFSYALQALPGAPRALDTFLALNLISLWCIGREKSELPRFSAETAIAITAFLFLLCLRLPYLGTAEFQGDEARALFFAAGTAQGEDGILLLHRKGPGEVLLAAPSLLLTATVNETSARFPFALAGALSIVALFCLMRRISASSILPWVASALLALDGFLFAFSRIVQYQTVLVLFVLCAFLSAFEIRKNRERLHQYLSLCAGLAACGLLCHYDAALTFPALLAVVLSALQAHGLTPGQRLRALYLPALQAFVISACFYGPFLLSEHFGGTAGYLSQRIDVTKLPTNNLPRYLSLFSFYSGAVLVWTLYAGLIVVGVAQAIRCEMKALRLISLAGFALTAATIIYPSELGNTFGFVFFAAACVPLICCPSIATETRAMWLWVWAAITVLGFFFARPNTHFYVAHPALCILCALSVGELYTRLNWKPLISSALAVTGAAVLYISVEHLRFVFLDPDIEYRFAFPKAQPPLSPRATGGKLPAGAFFGFQHRSGWKAVAELTRRGQLQGSYGSNEEALITSWYLRGARRDDSRPDFFFIVTRPNDVVQYSPGKLAAEYSFWGRIYTVGQRTLDIYRRGAADGTPKRIDLAPFIDSFDRRSPLTFDLRAAYLSAVVPPGN